MPIARSLAFLSVVVLSIFAFAEDRTISTTMHGVLRSKTEYLSQLDPDLITGTLDRGKPAVVTSVRNASQDPLLYCVVVDGSQKPELDARIRSTASDFVRTIPRDGDRGRAIVFGKSMKQSQVAEWTGDKSTLAGFLNTPIEAKGSDPYAALIDCADELAKAEYQPPAIKAIVLFAGRPTEASPYSTDWFLQRFTRDDIQLYIVSFDPGLLTGGREMSRPVVPEPRLRRRWPPFPPPMTPRLGGWYAPSLMRIARNTAGDVIFAPAQQSADLTPFATRLRNQVELTVVASEKDADSYREFKLTAPQVELQVPSTLYVPKR